VKELTRRGINTVLTLREYGILDFDAKGVSAAIRVSPHYYNTESEIETFLGTWEKVSLLVELDPRAGARSHHIICGRRSNSVTS
jgi:selenocysteine lyase/cysteine desulfurase